MKTLIETLPDGTENYLVDLGELGIFFMSVFNGEPIWIETWVDHLKSYPEHKQEWCDVQVKPNHGYMLN